MIYTTASDVYTTTPLTSFARTILDDTNAAAMRATLSINGIGSETAPTITNLNTLTVAGEYFSDPGATGAPNGTDSFSVKHYGSNVTNLAFQEVFSHAGGARWWRGEVESVWGAWTKVQDALGFTPVEQGGGAGMGTDKIRIGWDGGAFRCNVNGIDEGRLIRNVGGSAGSNGSLSAPGSAPLYAARAWVNFNGTNGAIRAGGNVSSVVRNGVGDYTVNFTTAMPDANYAALATSTDLTNNFVIGVSITAMASSSVRFRCQSSNHAGYDGLFVNVAIFR
jgi:hypothetical protein